MTDKAISSSQALKKFKKMIGQNNHFLITILVGLDGIVDKDIEKNQAFNTCWNPKNIEVSVERSRLFAIKAALAWCVDALDAYFMMSYRSPQLVQEPAFASELDGAGQSIFSRLLVFSNQLKCFPPELLLVKLAIKWRNRLVHFGVDNTFEKRDRDALCKDANYFKDNYRNLDVKEMLMNFDQGTKSIPTFKEITSIISGTIRFVSDIDVALVSRLDCEKYMDQIITDFIGTEKSVKQKKIESIWCKPKDLRSKKVTNVFRQYGLDVEDEMIEKRIKILATMNYKEACILYNSKI